MESDAGSVAGSDPVFEPVQPLDTARKWGLTPWRRRVIAIAEILLCSSVPTQILIGGVLLTSGMAPMDGDGTLSLPFVLVLSVVDTILLVGLMVCLTRMHGDSVAGLWLGERPVKAEALHGLLLIPVVFVMVVILLGTMRLSAPWLHNVTVNPLEQLAGTPGQAALFAIVAIVAGGLREELQRAFLLRRFEQHLGGVTVGVVVLSIGFGLGHIVQGWDAVITTGTLGAFWAVVYVRRRSVVAPVISHAGFNSLEILRIAIAGT